MISFIVAFDEDRGIGLKGSLPWHIKDDLKVFRQKTIHQTILMGQTTFDHMPTRLKEREIIVVSIDPTYKVEGIEVINDLIKFLKEHQFDEKEYIVCGGASIYAQSYPYASKAYISFVKGKHEVDTYFTAYKKEDWEIEKEVEYDEFIYRELKRKW